MIITKNLSSKSGEDQTIYFLYDNKGLLAEYDEAGELIRQYDYYSDYWSTAPMYQYSKATNPDGTESEQYSYSFYQNDHLGTPQLLIEKNGAVSWQGAYEAFGAIQQLPQSATASTKENTLRFPGQYQDIETDTYYNYHRDYAPELGRYVQSDLIGLTGGINLYLYSINSPITSIDSTGFKSIRILDNDNDNDNDVDPVPPGPFGPVCGPEGNNLALWVPDWWFTEACQNHDDCYDCSGISRNNCDDTFCEELLEACPERIGRPTCLLLADLYCSKVRSDGHEFYKDKNNPVECPSCEE